MPEPLDPPSDGEGWIDRISAEMEAIRSIQFSPPMLLIANRAISALGDLDKTWEKTAKDLKPAFGLMGAYMRGLQKTWADTDHDDTAQLLVMKDCTVELLGDTKRGVDAMGPYIADIEEKIRAAMPEVDLVQKYLVEQMTERSRDLEQVRNQLGLAENVTIEDIVEYVGSSLFTDQFSEAIAKSIHDKILKLREQLETLEPGMDAMRTMSTQLDKIDSLIKTAEGKVQNISTAIKQAEGALDDLEIDDELIDAELDSIMNSNVKLISDICHEEVGNERCSE